MYEKPTITIVDMDKKIKIGMGPVNTEIKGGTGKLTIDKQETLLLKNMRTGFAIIINGNYSSIKGIEIPFAGLYHLPDSIDVERAKLEFYIISSKIRAKFNLSASAMIDINMLQFVKSGPVLPYRPGLFKSLEIIECIPSPYPYIKWPSIIHVEAVVSSKEHITIQISTETSAILRNPLIASDNYMPGHNHF